mmetsp:Transcript_74480/g.125465  ORF Transcript_74480/g.125465 Transcript_74480/m.125465 type:complete len:87 (+) Transcript_74480:528-788(+)
MKPAEEKSGDNACVTHHMDHPCPHPSPAGVCFDEAPFFLASMDGLQWREVCNLNQIFTCICAYFSLCVSGLINGAVASPLVCKLML